MASPQPPVASTNGSYLQQADPQSFQTNPSAIAPVPNYQTQGSAPQQSTADSGPVPKDEVGWYFVEQYYTTLNKTPERLHLFYNKRSSFVWGTEGELLQLATSRSAIQEKIQSYEFKDCKVRVSNVDSQASADNGIVIQVLGEMSNNGLPNRKFSQTFFLAEQPNGYYVLNDIFRYLKDDDDLEEGEDYDSAEEIPEEPYVEAVVSEAVATPADELVEDMNTKETTKTEIEIEGDKIKIEETVTVEPALPVLESQGASPPVNGNAQSVNGDSPIAEPEHKPEPEPEPEPELEPEPEPEPEPQVEEPVASALLAPTAEAVPPRAEEGKAAPPPVKEPEYAHTPVAVPKPTPTPAPAAPKPKTWASLVATNTKSPAPAAKTAAALTAQAQQQPPPAPSTSTSASASTAAPAGSNTSATSTSDSQWQTKHSRGSSVAANSATSPTIANFRAESVSVQELKEVFSKFGPLKRCEINRSKGIIEFETPAGFTSASAANPHTIGDTTIYIEEQRPRPTTGAGSGGRGPTSGRGFQPSSQGRRGGYAPREGGFRGESRGGTTGGRGSRGGYYPPRGGPRPSSTPTGPN